MFKKFQIFLILSVISVSVFAQQFIIEKSAGTGKDSVTLKNLTVNGETAALFKKTLEADLVRSGYFTVDNGEYTRLSVSGNANSRDVLISVRIQVSWSNGGFVFEDTASGKREAKWLAHRLSDEMVKHIKGKTGMASSRIAFIGKEAGGGTICITDSDGSNIQKFSPESIPPLSPYFSKDGRMIYYTSFVRGYPCVYRVPVVGGAREPLANFTGLNTGGAVSPDGKLIAVILSQIGNPELCVINLATLKATRLTYTKRAAEASPAWSPDGEHIAYVSDELGTPQIFTIDSSSKKAKRISFRGSQNVAPAWGPDGRIAYCTKQGRYQIAVYDPKDGSSKIITDSNYDYEDPSWMADGRHIVCSRQDGRNRSSLWVFDTEGDAPYKLPLPAGEWRAPDASGLISIK